MANNDQVDRGERAVQLLGQALMEAINVSIDSAMKSQVRASHKFSLPTPEAPPAPPSAAQPPAEIQRIVQPAAPASPPSEPAPRPYQLPPPEQAQVRASAPPPAPLQPPEPPHYQLLPPQEAIKPSATFQATLPVPEPPATTARVTPRAADGAAPVGPQTGEWSLPLPSVGYAGLLQPRQATQPPNRPPPAPPEPPPEVPSVPRRFEPTLELPPEPTRKRAIRSVASASDPYGDQAYIEQTRRHHEQFDPATVAIMEEVARRDDLERRVRDRHLSVMRQQNYDLGDFLRRLEDIEAKLQSGSENMFDSNVGYF